MFKTIAQTGAVLVGFEPNTSSLKIKAYKEKLAHIRLNITNITTPIDNKTSKGEGYLIKGDVAEKKRFNGSNL